MSKPSNGAMKCAEEMFGDLESMKRQCAHNIDRHVQPLVDEMAKLIRHIEGEFGEYNWRTEYARTLLREWKESK